MTDTPERGGNTRRPRQFSISLAENPHSAALNVILRWRTFPCTAQHWDGAMFCEIPWSDGPIQSQEALRAALMEASLQEWHLSPVGRP